MSDAVLSHAEELIRGWWSAAYRAPDDPALFRQFDEEVRATLPIDTAIGPPNAWTYRLEDAAVEWSWPDEPNASTDLDGVFAAVR